MAWLGDRLERPLPSATPASGPTIERRTLIMRRSRFEGVVAATLTLALLVGSSGRAPTSETSGATTAVVVRAGSLEQAAEAVEAVGGSVGSHLGFIGGVSAELAPAAVQALRADPGLQVELDAPMTFASTPSEPSTDAATTTETQLAAMNLGENTSGSAGAGVGVALIDTGVDETDQLAGRVVHGPNYSDGDDGVDDYGHGTFMAGLIAGASGPEGLHDGVAPGAHVVSLKLAGRDGVTSLAKVLDAIGWVVVNQEEHGIRVLNLSIGVPTDRAPQADPLAAAVEAAWASGITVVAAAGNEGAGTVTSPGRDPWVLTVGSTDTNGTPAVEDDTVPDWSGSGKVVGNHKAELLAPGAGVVSLAAPGSWIAETYPEAAVEGGYFRGSGTSMSTALVSGAVASLLGSRPDATPDDVKGALVSTGAAIAGTPSRAIDLAAAEAAAPDDAWQQDHPIAFDQLDGRLKQGMPWSQTSASESWARASWARASWARASWARASWARASWARASWARASWARASWARASWATVGWDETGELAR
jgi:serine protease AprX